MSPSVVKEIVAVSTVDYSNIPPQEKTHMKPTVGRIVHYQAFGTPRGEYPSVPRAAIVTDVTERPPVQNFSGQVDEGGYVVGLCVLNPTGMFFNANVTFDEGGKPGTWRWPPRDSAPLLITSKELTMKTKPASILFPSSGQGPLVISPKTEGYAEILVPLGRSGYSDAFKITGAERVEGIDYNAFDCTAMFLGSMSFYPPSGTTWPLSQMFLGFSWPGGGLSEHASNIPYVGQVDFHFRLRNNSDVPQRFQIKLVGLKLA